MFKGMHIKTLLLFFAFITPTIASATPMFNPIVTLGAGASIEQVGRSQSYQPLDICSYHYQANASSATRFLGSIFFGSELSLPTTLPLLMDIGLEYNQSSTFTANGTLTQGADSISANTYAYRYHVQSQQVLIDGKLQWNVFQKFYLYGLVGLGLAINDVHAYQTNVPMFYEYTPAYSSHRQTNFSYSVGAGIGMPVMDRWRIGLGYRFTDLGQSNLGKGNINSIPIANTLKQSHLYANEIVAELTYLPFLK